MVFRFITRREGEALVIEIVGRLTEDGVVELHTLAQAAPGPVTLDLRDLRFADAPGLRSLRELRAAGTTLTGVSPYLSLLLESAGESAQGVKDEKA